MPDVSRPLLGWLAGVRRCHHLVRLGGGVQARRGSIADYS